MCTCWGAILKTESAAGLERSRMACALATAGKSSVRHTARGKANSKRRLVINLCKKDFMSFYQFSTGFLYRPIVYHLYPSVK